MNKRQKIAFAATSIIVCLSIIVGISYLVSQRQMQMTPTDGSAFTVAQLPQGTPDFDTILPAGKTIADYGGWTRVSPSTASPVYAYADMLSGSPIRVSQQPLPDGFKDDTAEQVSALAHDLGANQVLNVGDTVVHMGTSVKGPQSLILMKHKLLVLIRSSVVIPNNDWAAYINSLQ